MAEPFLDSLKNVVPSLEKATDVSFLLLLTSFVLLADCAALYVNGMNILHLSEVTDIIKPRLAVEAIILVIVFGVLVISMRLLLMLANFVVIETVGRLWTRFEIWADPHGHRFQQDSDYVTVSALRRKAHASKESYYLNLLKEADEEENEHRQRIWKTADLAFTVLVLSGVNLFAPLSPNGTGILAEIVGGLGQNRFGLLFSLGCILVTVALAFYPIFEDRRKMVHCPELAQELEEKRRQEREQQERYRREVEKLRASPPPPLFDMGDH